MNFNFGSRALLQYATYSDAFYIEPPPSTTPAPVASGTMQKRKNSESQHKFDCPTGQTYCWTGERQEYACMDTSADVTACGRCPYAPGSESDGPGDCTSIESADDVQCVNSKCVGMFPLLCIVNKRLINSKRMSAWFPSQPRSYEMSRWKEKIDNRKRDLILGFWPLYYIYSHVLDRL
jgi:hypothetical protein